MGIHCILVGFVVDLEEEVHKKLNSGANGVGNVDNALARAEDILAEARQKDFYDEQDRTDRELA
jgi:hypothetical protein